jgi:hypothetical protein
MPRSMNAEWGAASSAPSKPSLERTVRRRRARAFTAEPER